MYKLLLSLSILLCSQVFASKTNNISERPFYGKEIIATKAVILDKVISDYDSYSKKDIVMEAAVEKVCAKKGCWMTLQGSSKTFRVKFHDYSFFVPLALIGKKVWVEGRVKRKEVSVSDTRHYLEDAGASKSEIEAVIKPSFEYRFVAKGVKLVK